MLIVGARGFAKEVLEVLHQLKDSDNVVFYDDFNADAPDILYERFLVLHNIEEAAKYFSNTDNRFTIGIGNPILRKKLFDKFSSIDGKFTSTISPLARIGNFGNTMKFGCNIMTGAVITNDIKIQKGVLINLNSTIGHDSTIGCFVEISPGVHVSGNCKIGDYSILGTNATILPKVKLGKNVIVGAGALVTKDIPANSLVVGVPARVIKELKPLNI